MKMTTIKTKGEARQKAIEWQTFASNKSLNYFELWEWNQYFYNIGKKFGLLREFKREGIC